MNVLSLFDGVSCGYQALKEVGINVDSYYASEVDSGPISISNKNHSDIIRVGDVKDLKPTNLPKIDLLIGGSPCQNLSMAGTKTGLLNVNSLDQYLTIKKSGIKLKGQSYLFWEYVRLLRELKPAWLLLENVNMRKEWVDIFNRELGVKGTKINSNLFGAQSRVRYYWTNIPIKINNTTLSPDNVESILVPTDKTIKWLDGNLYPIPHFNGATGTKGLGAYVTSPNQTPWNCETFSDIKNFGNIRQPQRAYSATGKSTTITTSNPTIYKIGDGFRRLTINELELLQGLPLNYTSGVSKVNRNKAIGNGWHVPTIKEIFKRLT